MRTLPITLLVSLAFAGLASEAARAGAPIAVVGTWQATLQTRNLRYVLEIAASHGAKPYATFFSIGRTPDPLPVESIRVSGSNLEFSVSQANAVYKGKVSPDRHSIVGVWNQGGMAYPLSFELATNATRWSNDALAHKTLFIKVAQNIRLEVLDWGGSGPPLVFLAGGGDTAHVYDGFAPKFKGGHHVYAVTRRGFGRSSHPVPIVENFTPDRLADDVLTVIDPLQLDKPVLAGHSMAGAELSSICTRHPEKVRGLIYMEAASGFAFYGGQRGAMVLTLDVNELRKELDGLEVGPQTISTIDKLLASGLPDVAQDLEDWKRNLQTLDLSKAPAPRQPTYQDRMNKSIDDGEQQFSTLNCPILAFFAVPASENQTMRTNVIQANAFEKGVPSAHVVRIPNADHYIYRTNEAEVEREMNAWMDQLPKAH
jgi:non-heme chloroperoxidase